MKAYRNASDRAIGGHRQVRKQYGTLHSLKETVVLALSFEYSNIDSPRILVQDRVAVRQEIEGSLVIGKKEMLGEVLLLQAQIANIIHQNPESSIICPGGSHFQDKVLFGKQHFVRPGNMTPTIHRAPSRDQKPSTY